MSSGYEGLTLRHLERDGLLVRTGYPTVPPTLARELGASLAGLTDWAESHRADIATARAAYDLKTQVSSA